MLLDKMEFLNNESHKHSAGEIGIAAVSNMLIMIDNKILL